jgi:hypothetical protein
MPDAKKTSPSARLPPCSLPQRKTGAAAERPPDEREYTDPQPKKTQLHVALRTVATQQLPVRRCWQVRAGHKELGSRGVGGSRIAHSALRLNSPRSS